MIFSMSDYTCAMIPSDQILFLKQVKDEPPRNPSTVYAHGFVQSEHIGQWATPHHLSNVRRGAPSWIWDYLAHSDITVSV